MISEVIFILTIENKSTKLTSKFYTKRNKRIKNMEGLYAIWS